MKARFTDSFLTALSLPDGKVNFLVWDEGVPGLAIRVGKQRKSWIYVYRPAGRGGNANPQKLTLGAWPAVTIRAAREAAKIEAGRIARGEDPAAARRVERHRDVSTVAHALDAYEASLEQREYVNIRPVMSTLRRNLHPFRYREVGTLVRGELMAVHDRIVRDGRQGAADDFRKHVRTFLDWCVEKEHALANVFAGMRKARATRAQKIVVADKGRALSVEELAAIWQSADLNTVIGRYTRALVLTGARRSEMARLEWGMVEDNKIVLPPTHTKQGRPHEIPLLPVLREIITLCPRVREPFVFASARTGGVMSGWNYWLREIQERSGVNEFTFHDLRRTFRTGLAQLGVEETVAELMLAHQRSELERIYNKAEQWELRTEAQLRWESFVTGLGNPPADITGNVVTLGRKRAA